MEIIAEIKEIEEQLFIELKGDMIDIIPITEVKVGPGRMQVRSVLENDFRFLYLDGSVKIEPIK